MRNFKKLIVWNKAIVLAQMTYELTGYLPKDELYGLTSQLRRSSVSIPSNIAEGCSRSNKDFCRFLSISLGSAFELETQLIILSNLGKISEAKLNPLLNQTLEIQKMLAVLLAKTRQRD